MGSVAHIAAFRGAMREILEAELSAGNTIAETRRGDWPYPDTVSVKLGQVFQTPPRCNLSGITYREFAVSHGRKAEYEDQANHLLLISGIAE